MAVYFITDGNAIKIGYTQYFDAKQRIAQLQTANPRPLRVLGVRPDGTPENERMLHRELRKYRLRGEWFDYTQPGVQQRIAHVLSFQPQTQHRTNQRPQLSPMGSELYETAKTCIVVAIAVIFVGLLALAIFVR